MWTFGAVQVGVAVAVAVAVSFGGAKSFSLETRHTKGLPGGWMSAGQPVLGSDNDCHQSLLWLARLPRKVWRRQWSRRVGFGAERAPMQSSARGKQRVLIGRAASSVRFHLVATLRNCAREKLDLAWGARHF